MAGCKFRIIFIIGSWIFLFRTGRRTVSEGIAVLSRKDPSVFIYKVNSILPSGFAPGTGFYQVLDTDYKNYAIIWKCNGYGVLYTGMNFISDAVEFY